MYSRMRLRCRALVKSAGFDGAVLALIAVNMTMLALEIDVFARTRSQGHLVFKISERFFCVAFVVEMVLRALAARRCCHSGDAKYWTTLDVVLVFLQLVDVTAAELLESRSNPFSGSVARILRVLRALRLLRIISIAHDRVMFAEIRTFTVAIAGTLRTLMVTMVVLFLINFLVALVFTQIAAQHDMTVRPEDRSKDDADLHTYWGSLGKSMLVLFQALTGGIDWGIALSPLSKLISPWLAVPMVVYVCFNVFALMNVVTGIFVESAFTAGQREKERYLLRTVKALFKVTDADGSGDISWEEFQDKLDTPAMHSYFEAIDLDLCEAEDLFRLIDIDSSGSIDPEEFVNGCIRLQGPAKALDLATLMAEYKRSSTKSTERSRKMAAALRSLISTSKRQGRASKDSAMALSTGQKEEEAARSLNVRWREIVDLSGYIEERC